jgi:hypothetical protein
MAFPLYVGNRPFVPGYVHWTANRLPHPCRFDLGEFLDRLERFNLAGLDLDEDDPDLRGDLGTLNFAETYGPLGRILVTADQFAAVEDFVPSEHLQGDFQRQALRKWLDPKYRFVSSMPWEGPFFEPRRDWELELAAVSSTILLWRLWEDTSVDFERLFEDVRALDEYPADFVLRAESLGDDPEVVAASRLFNRFVTSEDYDSAEIPQGDWLPSERSRFWRGILFGLIARQIDQFLEDQVSAKLQTSRSRDRSALSFVAPKSFAGIIWMSFLTRKPSPLLGGHKRGLWPI